MRSLLLLLLLSACALAPAQDSLVQRPDVREFIDGFARRHALPAAEVDAVLSQARISESILAAISRPAEAKPWHEYRRIFVQPDRIRGGVDFWHEHVAVLERATAAYGVPPEIIVAIIGVETRYGKHAGSYRVLDALATLAFGYPKRAPFFRGELEQFLLLTREQGMDPLALKGSYAGAMGAPQFIPSSYRRYAVDFDIDGRTDIWANMDDAIGSVGNYFREHGWLSGGPVAVPLGQGAAADALVSDQLEPGLSGADLDHAGVRAPVPVPPGSKVKVLRLQQESAADYWLGFWNFYVITRYNHSVHYAMAVYQLAQEIQSAYAASTPGGAGRP